MLCDILLPIFLFGLFMPLATSRHVQIYRKDYKYIEKYDAFYKMHWDIEGLSWNSAFLTCREEGAQLFYPKAENEWTIVKNMTSSLSDEPNVTDIFVGIHDEYNMGSFITVDGQSTSSPIFNTENPLGVSTENERCVIMSMETGTFRRVSCVRPTNEPAPYICKKLDDESCPTIDRGYKFMKANKKCYKINEKKKSWQGAMQTCFMEGGILTVIDNKAEAEIIKSIIKYDSLSQFYVGFRKIEPYDDYYTVTGEEISSHYINWGNSYTRDNQPCGAVYLDDTLHTSTTNCFDLLPFICEMEVKV